MSGEQKKAMLRLEADHLGALIAALKEEGYTVVGPHLRDGAIVYAELDSEEDLPRGWTDEQEGGTYRVKKRQDGAFFGYNVGPHSWKQFLFPPELKLWEARREDGVLHIEPMDQEVPRFAFLGARSCELHAIAIQDRVFTGGAHADTDYRGRRENLFVVAVQCAQAGATCFCASMGTGPKADEGFDLALTEVLEGEEHYFTVEAGSERGAALAARLPQRPAREAEVEAAARCTRRAEEQMGRHLDGEGLKELLYKSYDHPRWQEVAARCLSCANCTMVCPTCFCHTVEDHTDLQGETAERRRRWDSCFTMDFSYIHGGSVRHSSVARYRQWLTHKLGTWIDQFGSSGCVGCGRCITWCPVGIDITEEVRALRAEPGKEN